MARIRILAVAAVLILVGLSPALVQAADELTIVKNSASVSFPGSIDFYLTVESDQDIVDIRLRYHVERESFAEVISEIYIDFEPATVVDTGWSWDLRPTGGLPPGSVLYYWWRVTDAGGDQMETLPVRLEFVDTDHGWGSITEGQITLYWYEGDASFADELMAAAQAALEQLHEDTGAHLQKAVDLYIYAGAQDLRSALMFPQEWTGGVAYTRYGTIAIGIATYNIEWGKRAITHELTHLVTHQMTFNPYGNLPNWLNEGLSMYAEGEMEAVYQVYLEQAVATDSLLSLRSLASPFSAYAATSYLAYAQSHSIVGFLIEEYGQQKMFELLSTFGQGSTGDGALLKVYGFDMDSLNNLWRSYIMAPAPVEPVEQLEVTPALIGLLVLVIGGLFLSLFLLWRRRR